MGNCKWTVYLDEEAQLIVQRIEGEMDEEEFCAMTREIERCAARLRNPADLRFLVDGRCMGKTNARTRKLSITTFRERGVNRMAIWGCNTLMKVLIRFMSVAEGNGRIRTFSNEEEARAWLAG